MAVRLASLNELKTELRIPAAETAYDAILAQKLEATSADCEAFCNRTFTLTAHSSEKHRGGYGSVVVNHPPIAASPAPIVLDFESGSLLLTTVDTDDYFVDYAKGIIYLQNGGVFSEGPSAAQITYTGGYASTGSGDSQKITVPDELSASVRELAAARFKKQQGSVSADELKAEEDRARRAWGRYRLNTW